MKRSALLFLSSFIITGLLAVGYYTVLKQNRAANGTVPATANTPVAAPEQQPQETTAPAEQPKEEPAASPETAEPAPEVKPEPAPEPQPQEPVIKGRNPEHTAALTVAAALAAENPAEALQKLVDKGTLAPEAAEALTVWAATHKVKAVEEVGNSYRPNGERHTRYRLVSEDGSEDMVLDIVTRANGKVEIVSAKAVSADKTQVTAGADSLTVAEGFVEAVRRGDMMTARKMADGVSDATVAGLCMIFEEGEFRLRDEKPIRNAFENAEHSGYFVNLLSKANNFPAAFGLEMSRTDAWHVSAVSLDELLASYENQASAEGGRYFPIVKNPQGGDSLALFFGFNEHELTPRSLRQLQIVAELLKQSQGKLDISGHTDDVGSETYNQKLSEKRADAVRDALVSFGVAAEQISTAGMGKSQPRRVYATDDTEQQIDYIRGENRRAEIYLDFH